jgi:flagellar M-ring protein FliF
MDLLRAAAAPLALALVALVVVFKLIRPALNAVLQPPPAAAAPVGTQLDVVADNEIVAPALPPPTPLAALNPPPQTHQKLESARAFAQQNPAAVAQIVKDWVGTPPAPKAS